MVPVSLLGALRLSAAGFDKASLYESCNCVKLNAASNLNGLEKGPLASGESPALADTLTSALYPAPSVPQQRTLSHAGIPDVQKL